MKRKARDNSTVAHAGGGPPCALAAVILAFFIGLVYLPAATVPLIFDDVPSIVQNDSIVSLWPLVGSAKPGPLNPPPEHPTSGRPLVNLAFAVVYHFVGLNPTGYHLLSIGLHFFNAMLLWAITRRTLTLSSFNGRFGTTAGWLALAVALLWALHPLQTESVIYATQCTELMMAFFYLSTLYCSLRYWDALPSTHVPSRSEGRSENHQSQWARYRWLFLAIGASFCGMACKEVMVSAPLIVLLFERAFIAGTLKSCLRRSWPLYIGLALSLLLVVGLSVAGPRPDSAGFHLGVQPHVWWFTQAKILFLYLKLAVWPWPLLIHYELPYVTKLANAWNYVLPLLVVGIATLVLLWKNRPLGFLGAWFFAILSPTFVIPVVTEMAAERRMYLALAPLTLVLVVACYWFATLMFAKTEKRALPQRFSPQLIATGVPIAILALLLCFASASRLAAYENELTLWLEVMQAQPNNARAHFYAATYLESQGKIDEAVQEYHEAIRLQPNPVQAHYRLGELFNNKREYNEAARHFGKAARGLPTKNANFFNSEAVALYMAGRNDEAIAAYHRVLEIDPNFWPAYRNLGNALQKAGKFQEAVQAFEAALRLNPEAIDIYNDLANSYLRLKQKPQAIAALEQGLRLAQAAGDAENVKKLSAALQANH